MFVGLDKFVHSLISLYLMYLQQQKEQNTNKQDKHNMGEWV